MKKAQIEVGGSLWLVDVGQADAGRISVRFGRQIEHHDLAVMLREEWRREADAEEFSGDPPVIAGAWTGQLDAGHTCPDWEAILHLGLTGLRDRAAGRDPNTAPPSSTDCWLNALPARPTRSAVG